MSAKEGRLGEEAGRSGESAWRWYLDPIDGTSRFIRRDPKWMTLIALGYEEAITLGVVDLPAIGERWWAAEGAGAFRDGQRIDAGGAVATNGHIHAEVLELLRQGA